MRRHGNRARPVTEPSEQNSLPTMLRLPGLVSGVWILVPFVLCWAASLGLALRALTETRPHLAIHLAALYGCAMFFAHGYALGWRAGSIVFRYAALLLAVLLFAALGFWALDEADARVIYPGGELLQRGRDGRQVAAAATAFVAGALLLSHGFVLGLGSRPARRLARRLSATLMAESAPEPTAPENDGDTTQQP